MPVSVPSSPKVLTTKYQNWRGVDYTNDPSNVWYRRSPNGLNMLPNLDGNPFKRNGWKIEFTPGDFCDAANISPHVDVVQYKVDYFELDGKDWLALYTSIGLFFYSDSLIFVDTYVPEIKLFRKTSFYKKGDYVFIYGNSAPPEKYYYKANNDCKPADWTGTGWSNVDTEVSQNNYSVHFPPTSDAVIDYTKSFFFEGQGTAGYYLFVGTQMFRFDGEKLYEADAKIPKLLIGTTPSTGAGELAESVNLLTEARAVEYMADGTDTYKLPQAYATTVDPDDPDTTYPTGILYVCIANPLYESGWEETDEWTTTANPDEIKFNAGHVPPLSTEDSVRIVYMPSDMSAVDTQKNPDLKTLKLRRRTKKKFLQEYISNMWVFSIANLNMSTMQITPISTETSYGNYSVPSFDLDNPKSPLASNVTYILDNNGVSVSSPTGVTGEFNSYGSSVTIKASDPQTVFNTYTAFNQTESTTKTFGDSWISKGSKITRKGGKYRYVYETTDVIKSYKVGASYMSIQYEQSGGSKNRSAFFASSRATVFGNGIINQVFLTASTASEYLSRVWYSAATDPTYFPDTNYIEVGSTDKRIMGLIRVGQYLGVVKQGSGKETSIYLAYATSFEDTTTYAVKQSVNGIGAVSNGAFNILNDEPMFLSSEGVIGIEPSEDEERKLRNRSYYVNKPIIDEPSVETAFSFIYKGMYWLGTGNHVYVLDGSQKTSWENTKTNLQYEAYYLDNIPAKCFAKKDDALWFIDGRGNLCRFRDSNDEYRYVDDYSAEPVPLYSQTAPVDMKIPVGSVVYDGLEYSDEKEWTNALKSTFYNGTTISADEHAWTPSTIKCVSFSVVINGKTFYGANVAFTTTSSGISITAGQSYFNDIDAVQAGDAATYTITYTYVEQHETALNDVIVYNEKDYTVTKIKDGVATLSDGIPISSRWSTIADDDGSANYYKKLQKRGSLVAVMPMSDSGVKVYLIPDEKEPIFVGETDIGNHILPFNYYLRKKVKNYKRLQIVCENASYNDGFGIDEIIKCYTIGNYAKR